MDLNAVLRHAVESGASDIHFKVGQPPVLRFDGELAPAEAFSALGDADSTLRGTGMPCVVLRRFDRGVAT